MPFFVEIRRASNGQKLAVFHCSFRYFYRLVDGVEFPLQVAYAWCHRCEAFVEAERLYTFEEVHSFIDALAARKSDWPRLDAQRAQKFAECGCEMPPHVAHQALYNTWVAALEWLKTRKTPPRCLKCGSFFAVKMLPNNKEIPHPSGSGTIEVGIAGHASTAGIPDRAYFNSEGIRITNADGAKKRIAIG